MSDGLSSFYSTLPVTIVSFVVFFMLRKLFIKRKLHTLFYYAGSFLIIFIFALGGGGVQNDGYERLEKFILLEENNELEHAKKNPENYDNMFQIDLRQFNNSREFRNYLKKHDAALAYTEAAGIGWLFALLAEISLSCAMFIGRIRMVRKNRQAKS